MPASDRAWVDSALGAWARVERESLRLPAQAPPMLVLFDRRCVWRVGGEARGAGSVRAGGWTLPVRGARHGGAVPLPSGDTVPAAIVSFAASYGPRRLPFLVMSLPEVWRAQPRVAARPRLDALLRAVFVHEMTHTRQSAALGARLDELERRPGVGDELNDDLVQKRFGERPGFREAVEREVALLHAAAAAPTPAERRARAAEALRAIDQRQARFFTGADSVFREVDDVFLDMEGVGNWAAYRSALNDGVADADARELVRGRGWTQHQGLALYLVLDAIMPGWQRRVFAERPASVLPLLREAVR